MTRTPEEIAAALGVSVDEVKRILAENERLLGENQAPEFRPFDAEDEEAGDDGHYSPDEEAGFDKRWPEPEPPEWPELKPNGYDRQANGADPLPGFNIFYPGLDNRPIPPRHFFDSHKFIPMHGTHIFNGDGGMGKTEVLLQAMIGTCLTGSFANMPCERGQALMYSAEEDRDEIMRRIEHLAVAFQFHRHELEGRLAVIDASQDHEAWLFKEDPKTKMTSLTTRGEQFIEHIEMVRPKLIGIDNRAQIVCGDQNNFVTATTVTRILNAISRKYHCAIALLSHVSISQQSSGRGDFGSVGWSNTARARSSLEPPKETDGKQRRQWTLLKANGTATGLSLDWVWDEGLGYWRCEYQAPKADDQIGRADKDENLFLHLFNWHNSQSINVSALPKAPNYAPMIFAQHPKCERCSQKKFTAAMLALIDKGVIKNVEFGPPSKRRAKLVFCNL